MFKHNRKIVNNVTIQLEHVLKSPQNSLYQLRKD